MPLKDPAKRREYQRSYMRRWYRENKAKHIALVRGREKQIKAWLREYKESIGCEVCGEIHPACLEFHHLNPREKKFSVGRVNDFLSIRLIQSEIDKCRLLCANCHRKEHWNEHHVKTHDKFSPNEKRIAVDILSRRNPFIKEW